MAERVLAFRRLWTGYNERKQTHPDELRQLLRRIARYDAELAALAIEDHELDAYRSASSSWIFGKLLLQALVVFLVLPPILVFGYLVNLPPAALVWIITKRRSKADKDEATIKLLTGSVAFPVAWLAAALIIVFSPGAIGLGGSVAPVSAWFLGTVTFFVSGLGGLLTLHYQRFAIQTLRAIRLRMTHSDQASALHELRTERSSICDEVVQFARGIELPGTVGDDGRVFDEGSF